tara:strand:- start:397 stop:576 length:180 start_codon:yes stop_codon:yes gene_type:complete
MKVSKKRLKQIIKEELNNASLETKSLRDNAMEAIDALDEANKMKIMAYISSLEGNSTNE